jgi:hypothetical protein
LSVATEGQGKRSTSRTYVRALAAALERSQDRPVILSAKDWDLASDWCARGIPLGFVLELMEERVKRPPRSLAALARAVDEAWDVVRSGERGAPPAATGAGAPDRECSRNTASRAVAFETSARQSPPRCVEALQAAARDLREGSAAADVDRTLDDALETICPPEWIRAAALEVDDELRRCGANLPPEARERTRVRAVRDVLRTRLGLPRSTA